MDSVEFDTWVHKYEDACFFAAKHGVTACGLGPCCIGQVNYQTDGTRLVALIRADELELLAGNSLQD